MPGARKSDLELLRIILMASIVVFHLMVYNGVYFVDNCNAYIALVLSVGGAIPSDYAFIGLSAYFLLRKEDKGYRRLIRVATSVVFLYIIKYVTLRGLFGYNNQEFFVDAFLMKGAWWYIYPYLLLLLVYPLLNRLLQYLRGKSLIIVTVILALVVCVQSLYNKPNLLQDIVAFLFTYLLYACFKDDYCHLGGKIKRKHIIIIIAVCEIVMLVLALGAKSGVLHVSGGEARRIIRFLVGRYNPIGIVMGTALFYLFKGIDVGYNRVINAVASVTFYVFLLHETIMGVYWYFGRLCNDFGYYPTGEFILWTIIYVVSCFVVCAPIKMIFERTILRCVDNLLSIRTGDNE